jgi:hypothetical protein
MGVALDKSLQCAKNCPHESSLVFLLYKSLTCHSSFLWVSVPLSSRCAFNYSHVPPFLKQNWFSFFCGILIGFEVLV